MKKAEREREKQITAEIQSALSGRQISMLNIPKIRPEVEERMRLGADMKTAARLAVEMYEVKR